MGNVQTRIGIYADDNASASFRNVGKEADTLVAKLVGMGPKLSSVLGVLGLGAGGFAGGAFLKDATLAAARYETLGLAMHKAGENAGYNHDQMVRYETQLQKNGISMQESRTILARLSAANLDLAKSADIARAAQDVAVVGGIDSSEALDRMVQAIITAQPEMLRTLGLAVNFENVYAKAATAMGKTAKKLTDAEKLQIRFNAALEASSKYAGIYELSMTSASKQLGSFTRYWSDFTTLVGETTLGAFSGAVFGVNDALKSMNARLVEMRDSGQLKETSAAIADGLRTVTENADIAVIALGAWYAAVKLGNTETAKRLQALSSEHGIMATLRAELAGNTAMMGKDTAAYVANTQAALANHQARLSVLDKGIGAKQSIVAELATPEYATSIEAIKHRQTVEKELKVLQVERAVVTRQLSQATDGLTAATNRSSLAMRAMGGLKSGALGLVNFFGGPWAIGLSVATAAVYSMVTADSAAEKAAKSYGTSLTGIEDRYKKLGQSAKDAAAETANLTATHKKALEEQNKNAIAAAQKQIETARAALDGLSNNVGGFGAKEDGSIESNYGHVDAQLIAKFQAITDALKTQSITAQEAELRFRNLKAEADTAASGMSGVFNRAKTETQDFSGLIAEMIVHVSQLGEKSNDLEKLGASLGNLVAKATSAVFGVKELNAAMSVLAGKKIEPAKTLDAAILAVRDYTKSSKEAKQEARKTEESIAKANLAVIKKAEETMRASGKVAEADKLAAEYAKQKTRIPQVDTEKNSAAASRADAAKRSLQGVNAEIEKLKHSGESFDAQLAKKLADIAKTGKDAGLSFDVIKQKQQEYSAAANADNQRKYNEAIRDLDLSLASLSGNMDKVRTIETAKEIEELTRKFAAMGPVTDETTAKINELATAREKQSRIKDVGAAAAFYKELHEMAQQFGAAQEYNNELLRIQGENFRQNAGISKELVDQWTDLKMLETSRETSAGMKRAFRDYASDATNEAKNMGTIIGNTFSGIENSFTSFCTTGKLEFSSLANSIISDLSRIVLRQSVTGPLAGALGNIVGSFFTGSGSNAAFDTLASNVVAGVQHDGGMTGASGMAMRYAPMSLFANAPRYHGGGPILAPGEVPIIAKHGEVMLSNEDVRDILKNKGQQSGSPITLAVELKNESGQPMQAKSSQTQWAGDMKSAVVTIILDAVNRNYMGARDALRG